MQKLMAQLRRLYLLKEQRYREVDTQAATRANPPAAPPLTDAILERHLRGEQTVAIDLVDGNGATRAMLVEFRGPAGTAGSPHWDTVCEAANALQTQLGLPAPAVSISGVNGYGLWLSLETPVPAARARQFLRLLRQVYFSDVDEDELGLLPGAAKPDISNQSFAALPPCLRRDTGRWAAFINPGMGASFADEPGLEMPPPVVAQTAFLEGLHCISATQFDQALITLEAHDTKEPDTAAAPTLAPRAVSDGLLLKDATLEDIVRHLHEKNIEPTFRHLIGK